MDHGPAFQDLWSSLGKEVRDLQSQGYYGDGDCTFPSSPLIVNIHFMRLTRILVCWEKSTRFGYSRKQRLERNRKSLPRTYGQLVRIVSQWW